MRTLLIALTALMLFATPVVALAGTYTCTDFGNRGFDGRSGDYEPAEFSVITFKLEADWNTKVFTEKIKGATLFDSVTTTYRCQVPFHEGASNLWQCVGDFKQISFNVQNGKYVRTSTFGFAIDRAGDPIFIAFGRCKKP